MQIFSNLNHILAEIETMSIGLLLCSLQTYSQNVIRYKNDANILQNNMRLYEVFYYFLKQFRRIKVSYNELHKVKLLI